MRIEDLKRWHWVVVGLVLGLAMAYAQVGLGMEGFAAQRATVSQMIFERELNAEPVQGHAILSDIVVYRDGNDYTVKMKRFLQKDRNDPAVWVYRDSAFHAKGKPYTPLNGRQNRSGASAPRPDYTVLDYLKDRAAQDPNIKFNYAWWKEPKATFAIWTIGSVVVIGGIWPTVVSLLVGAGFGRAKKDEPEYDLDRFKGEPEAAKAAATPADDAALRDRVDELEEELMANLKASDADRAEEPQEAPVRALTAGPLDSATRAPGESREDKSYKGEYYPVVRPAGEKQKKS